jgi:dienelactone hydrolase
MGSVRSEGIEYSDGEETFEGFVAWKPGTGRAPAVLIAHDWAGLHDLSRSRAVAFAESGRVGFAIDVYGKGRRGTPNADNSALMGPLLADRALLRRRLLAAVEACRRHEAVDPERLAVIGYCFGGLCALDVARANAPGVLGVVSFHGIYPPLALGEQAPIRAKVLVCDGWDDPHTPVAAKLALIEELTAAKADWQLHAYGHTVHAFTTPGANNPAMGAVYDAVADRRSSAALRDFLDESFA